eukprot:gnl/Dysnectes_brevis/5644_a8236_409.p1 GENE.gnl/Dysnectes_brevis/5644_a8236_409~~gnl/Dysnectes_brevis/5644_a8236_409.p1  ORF type:complete len:412 (+),score=113.85 gnl/Dysnectes_brevis/5644_a8236_409:130-1365(+)
MTEKTTHADGTPQRRPLLALTLDLLKTYNHINTMYYSKTKKVESNKGVDDDKSNLIVHVGDVFSERYKAMKGIGQGSFGRVLQCEDQTNGEHVSLKVIRSQPMFMRQGRLELLFLTSMRDARPHPGKQYILQLRDSFEHKGHLCILTDLLGRNLYQLIKSTGFAGFPLAQVRTYCRCIAKALAFLKSGIGPEGPLDIIHCDLKPENLLLPLEPADRDSIYLIDFGSSVKPGGKMYSYVQSRFYRSPEVLLGLPYAHAVDQWSFGAVAYEMYMGRPLFRSKSSPHHLLLIASLIGFPPEDMIAASPNQRTYFQPADQVQVPMPTGAIGEQWALNSRVMESATPQAPVSRSLRMLLEAKTEGITPEDGSGAVPTPLELTHFLSFLEGLLCYDPTARMTPEQALDHPFLTSLPS